MSLRLGLFIFKNMIRSKEKVLRGDQVQIKVLHVCQRKEEKSQCHS